MGAMTEVIFNQVILKQRTDHKVKELWAVT